VNKDQLAARLRATFLLELDDHVRATNASLLALEAGPGQPEHLKALFRAVHTLKGAARAAGVAIIEEACHALETRLAPARDGKLALGPREFPLLFAAADALADAGARLRKGEDLTESPLSALRDRLNASPATPRRRKAAVAPGPPPTEPSFTSERADSQVRVDAEQLDQLLASTAQLLLAGGRVANRPEELEALHAAVVRGATVWSRTGRRLRVALERAGAPPALGEAATEMEKDLRQLVRETSRLAAAAAGDARAVTYATAELADRVRRLRMRPFAEACEALPRAVRDLAVTARKEVDLEILGGDVALDRAVLDALRPALLHLVRNAVDHGVEPPAERARKGKSRRGRVTVAAALRGDRVSVRVSDDGAGLDVRGIRTQLERGGVPVPPEDHEAVRALFQGGISTRAEVTALSGRGVGLDTVREAVEQVRGSVDVTWVPDQGSTFTLACPPTLATIRALLAAVGAQLVALPTTHVERCLRLAPEEIKHADRRAVIATPDGPVPLVALAGLLPPLVERPVAGPISAVLLRAGARRLAVAVDELVAEQEVVLRAVGRRREAYPHLSGAAVLPSGRVVLVLNPVAILDAGLGAGAGPGLTVAEPQATGPVRRRILVVDDSITTRTLEQSLLEAAGYDVLTAVDGADGWKVLQEHGCDLVVADVEMPRMDGFQLCEAIRTSKRFKELPVLLVTALESPEHRARGLEVGADAYLGKSSFDQEHLLDTITRLLG